MKPSLLKLLVLAFMLHSTFNNATAGTDRSFTIDNTNIVTIDSTVLDRTYDLYVKVPHDYFLKKNKSKKYPVLYLNDGPHTFKVASGVTHFAPMDKVIVVGISFAHGENGQHSRVRDLTPIVNDTWKKYQTGGAQRYLRFIESEVFKYVEDKYRVDPNQRILSGHSLGGSFGAWVLLSKPELFTSYILTSPSLWFKDYWIFDLEEKYKTKDKPLNANVYIATGSLETIKDGMYYDMADDQVKFMKNISVAKLPWVNT